MRSRVAYMIPLSREHDEEKTLSSPDPILIMLAGGHHVGSQRETYLVSIELNVTLPAILSYFP